MKFTGWSIVMYEIIPVTDLYQIWIKANPKVMDKCNDEDEIISLSSGSSSADDHDKDASARDFPEADLEVETLFSDIKVCICIMYNENITDWLNSNIQPYRHLLITTCTFTNILNC